jgi:acyl-CoA thioesterase FadM
LYVLGRLCSLLLRSLTAPRQAPDALIITRLRVWPQDLDLNLHLNNGRYLTLMDLGRYDLVLKAGLFPLMRRERWFAVLAGGGIKFRRSLGPFQAFDLTTQIIHWDEKWFYILHEFVRDGDVYARALVKGLFRGPEGNVPVQRLIAALGLTSAAPSTVPELVRHWSPFEKELR